MPDCFISHSSVDAHFARAVHDHIVSHGVTSFLAPVSVDAGERWSPAILAALRSSPWVVFLASRAACASPFVQQEVGGAIVSGKKLVPIVWDISPAELPAWAREYQAIDIRGASVETVTAQVASVATRIRANKETGALIVGGAIAALILMAMAGGSGK